MLRPVITMTHDLYVDIVRRIKFISKLSLNVTNIPQDGEYAFPHEAYEVKVRVSSLPSKFGEAFTLRLLDPKRGIVPLEKLGFQKEIEGQLRELALKPHGIFLVTGPTGSGKTTTILRQDPNVILVGEIRDAETAKTAADAALTGHMVFATLHTNSAIESIPRLISMGVDTYLLAPSLRAILGQRLVRKVCPSCKGKDGGCAACLQVGYKGRMTLPELLTIDKGMRDLILANVEQRKLEEYAKKQGFRTMRENGEALVKTGATTMEEIVRVTA